MNPAPVPVRGARVGPVGVVARRHRLLAAVPFSLREGDVTEAVGGIVVGIGGFWAVQHARSGRAALVQDRSTR